MSTLNNYFQHSELQEHSVNLLIFWTGYIPLFYRSRNYIDKKQMLTTGIFSQKAMLLKLLNFGVRTHDLDTWIRHDTYSVLDPPTTEV